MDSFQMETEAFLSCIAPWQDGYTFCRILLLAVRDGSEFKIVNGVLIVRADALAEKPRIHETRSVFAGQFDIEGGLTAVRQVIDEIGNGQLLIGGRKFVFPLPANGRPSAYFEFLNPVGLPDGRRLTSLKLSGASRFPFFNQARLDWELRSHNVPMDGLSEAAFEIGIPLAGDSCSFEVTAIPVAFLDAHSAINGATASISLLCASALDVAKVTLGYKVFHNRAVIERGTRVSPDFEWTMQGQMRRGTLTMAVPNGAMVHCFPTYNGEAQQRYWIVDPHAIPNARRAAYAVFDRELQTLRDFLSESREDKKSPQHDFENGVAVLLYLLGFSAINLGGIPRLQDAPDAIVTSPQGHYAIVECTLGLPDRDDKLTKLFKRSQDLRGALDRAGLSQKKLLPVIVTALPRTTVPKIEAEKAQELGIALVTSEDINSVLERSMFGELADVLYAEFSQSIETTAQLDLQQI